MKLKHLAAAVAMFAAVPVFAATCEATVEANDAMQYNTKEIVVDPSCEKFELTLKHVGKLPIASMGHNWVLAKTADAQPVVTDGMAAGASAGYLKADDERILAHTKMLGGGESDTIEIDLSKLTKGEDYTFFCSFPGHFVVMKGQFKY